MSPEAGPELSIPIGASLLLDMRHGDTSLAIGTGFLVRRDDRVWLLTNRHNVTGRDQETGQPMADHQGTPDRILIRHNSQVQRGTWTTRTERILDEEGNGIWTEHPTLGPQADVVALPLSDLDGVEVLAYDLAPTDHEAPLGPAMSVSIIGYPFGRTGGGDFGIWVTGSVASEPQLDWNDLPVFLVDARTREGQSGSPVIVYSHTGVMPMMGGILLGDGPDWRLHGIYSGRIAPDSDVGMVWKSSCLIELLDHASWQDRGNPP